MVRTISLKIAGAEISERLTRWCIGTRNVTGDEHQEKIEAYLMFLNLDFTGPA
jgi:hypothetical protein